ncbi:Hypothetical predicted protein [Mytilus galloprovincialis]|uniref:HAT C-terminal dimerisation domain-containing protein n=1 Tax=Mytilus galloprovincialis TaxID=29158 RepID=A0A8B6GHG7_MYTGA|nr:Hypothetical predicted protein [Mytilus galloprovincialis]
MSKRTTTDDNNNNTTTGPTSAKKSCQKFRDCYRETFPSLGVSKKGPTFVYCFICERDFSCAHGGKDDCRRHVMTKSHVEYNKLKSTQRPISSFIKSTELEKSRAVTKAEAAMCQIIANQNLSLASADMFTKNFKLMFPDSKIASEMKCGRNKATAMIGELANIVQDDLVQRMREGPFTISTDGSENIFLLIDKELRSRQIPWEHNLALGCDNASTMTGHKKGVIAFARKKHPDIFLAGCTLHLVHIAAKKAAESLPPVDEALTDIYYYFNKSDTRKQEFKGTQELYDVDQKKNLKHVCTRWLSISRCVERRLHNWDPLKDYFHTHKKKLDEAKLKKKVAEERKNAPQKSKTPMNKNDTLMKNKNPQESQKTAASSSSESTYCTQSYAEKKTEEPMIHVLRRSLIKLLRNVLTRFVKPSAFALAQTFDTVDYKSSYNQKTDQELVIGENAKEFIKNKTSNHLRENRLKEFYLNVRKYFERSCDHMIAKLPLKDELLKHAEVVDVTCKQTSQTASIMYFLNRFPSLLPKGVSKDIIVEQFISYQSYDLQGSGCVKNRIDETWISIGQLKDEQGHCIFSHLATVMYGIMTIPHSSAHCERVFSCVRKNRTEQRSCLGDNTLQSLLVVKSAKLDISTLDGKALDRLKAAYYRKLSQQ